MGLPPSEWNYPPQSRWRTPLIFFGALLMIIGGLVLLDLFLGWLAHVIYGVIA